MYQLIHVNLRLVKIQFCVKVSICNQHNSDVKTYWYTASLFFSFLQSSKIMSAIGTLKSNRVGFYPENTVHDINNSSNMFFNQAQFPRRPEKEVCFLELDR